MAQELHFYCVFVPAYVAFKYKNCKYFAKTYCTTMKIDKTFVHINWKLFTHVT